MKWIHLWPVPKPGRPVHTSDEGMVNFHVIGELRDNPRHLLMQGDDGQHYDYDLETGHISQAELDGSWAVDVNRPTPVLISAPVGSIAS